MQFLLCILLRVLVGTLIIKFHPSVTMCALNWHVCIYSNSNDLMGGMPLLDEVCLVSCIPTGSCAGHSRPARKCNRCLAASAICPSWEVVHIKKDHDTCGSFTMAWLRIHGEFYAILDEEVGYGPIHVNVVFCFVYPPMYWKCCILYRFALRIKFNAQDCIFVLFSFSVVHMDCETPEYPNIFILSWLGDMFNSGRLTSTRL